MNRVALEIILLLVPAAALSAQAPVNCNGKLIESKVETLLTNGVAQPRVEQIVRACGIDFEITAPVVNRLRRAGAGSRLIGVLREIQANKPGPGPVTSTKLPPPSVYTVSFRTDPPGANIEILDAAAHSCSTPCTLKLSPGVHGLIATRQGYISHGRRLNVPQDSEVFIELVPSASPAPKRSAPAAGETRVNPRDGLTYVWIPPGTFTMGCSPGDTECYPDENRPRQVTIANGFWIGQTEVTQAAYERVKGTNPSHFKGSLLPVETISWDEADAYCRAAGNMRLPTEAEWEYAARGGNPAGRYGLLGQVAWNSENSGRATHAVARLQANGFGLYDTLGNVWEWTAGWYDAARTDRPLRGGSWSDIAGLVRVSARLRSTPAFRDNNIGVRCAGE